MVLTLFRRFKPRYITLIFLVGFLSSCGLTSVYTEPSPKGEVIALSDDNGKIIVAYAHALYQIDRLTREWTSIALPHSVSRITAISANKTGRIYLTTPSLGILRSDDNGKTWLARNKGLPRKDVVALSHHAKQSDTLYAMVSEVGIFRSENAGDNWQLMDAGPEKMAPAFVHSDMPGSMQTGWLFVGTKDGVSRSMDCFCLWRIAGNLTEKVYGFTYDPNQPTHIYAATDHGIYQSHDGGEKWQFVNSPEAFVTTLVFT